MKIDFYLNVRFIISNKLKNIVKHETKPKYFKIIFNVKLKMYYTYLVKSVAYVYTNMYLYILNI